MFFRLFLALVGIFSSCYSLKAVETTALYVHGSCLNNPGSGAWGFRIRYPDAPEIVMQTGFLSDETTNNRLVLMAVIEGVKAIDSRFNQGLDKSIIIFSNSSYLVNGINKYLSIWRNSGWKKSDNKKIKNLVLWQEIDRLKNNHSISASSDLNLDIFKELTTLTQGTAHEGALSFDFQNLNLT